MNILVTGGAGYIGSITVEQLQDLDNNVYVIDNLQEGKREAIEGNSTFFEGDYGDEDLLGMIFSEETIDLVMHFAASANVLDSVRNPIEYYENNVANTVTLLRMMIENGVKRIIFSSTAAVYGEPSYWPIDENHPLAPINPYGRTKKIVEEMIIDFASACDLRYNILRYFCAAGASRSNGESREKETHLIPIVVDVALKQKRRVEVFGNDYPTHDGTGVRDYVHVLDIAAAHVLSAETIDKNVNEVFNLGSQRGYSVLEVISTSEKVLGTSVPFGISDRRPGDPAILIASFEKARNYLNWKPMYSLEEIILSAYQWRKNPLY